MAELVTAKDDYAAVIETALVHLGYRGGDASECNAAGVLIVQQLDRVGLMPTNKHYRRGGVSTYVGDSDEQDPGALARSEEVLAQPPTDLDAEAGEYVLTQYATPWRMVPNS